MGNGLSFRFVEWLYENDLSWIIFLVIIGVIVSYVGQKIRKGSQKRKGKL